MNKQISRKALIEQIHPALAHRGWHLVDAREDWFQNAKKIRAYYVIDDNDDVVEPYFDLKALAKDLQVLGECEIGDGCDTPPEDSGRAMEAVEPSDRHGAEVAAIMAAIGDRNMMAEGQGMKEDAGTHGLVDQENRMWISWPQENKLRHVW